MLTSGTERALRDPVGDCGERLVPREGESAESERASERERERERDRGGRGLSSPKPVVDKVPIGLILQHASFAPIVSILQYGVQLGDGARRERAEEQEHPAKDLVATQSQDGGQPRQSQKEGAAHDSAHHVHDIQHDK